VCCIIFVVRWHRSLARFASASFVAHSTTPFFFNRSSFLLFVRTMAASSSSGGKGKKGKEEEEKIYWGRPSNHLKIGLVGLPNVGKSSTFNILTKLQVPAENYPFCTIDPTTAYVEVPDPRFDWLVAHFKPASAVRALLSVTDIAGLVRGASTGAGLGNQFLSHIRDCDGIFHVVRVFEDETVTHDEGSVEPVRDLEIISAELRAKDIEQLKKNIEQLERYGVRQDKTKKVELDLLIKVLEHLEKGQDIRNLDWKVSEVEIINNLRLFAVKPRIYLANMSKDDFIKKKNKWGMKLKKWVEENGNDPIIPYSVTIEDELIASGGQSPAGVASQIPKIIKAGYHHLSLAHYFTCGEDEVKCWTIKRGTKAPQAAGIIHTDFERGFIKAEVMKFEEYKELGSEAAMKAAGKYRVEGKNYEVQDGDIIFFKFNAAAGLTTKKAK
jgi:obg-like ATPase 1